MTNGTGGGGQQGSSDNRVRTQLRETCLFSFKKKNESSKMKASNYKSTQKENIKKPKPIQCSHAATAVIAFSGRCFLVPFHHGPAPSPPLHRAQNTEHVTTRKTKELRLHASSLAPRVTAIPTMISHELRMSCTNMTWLQCSGGFTQRTQKVQTGKPNRILSGVLVLGHPTLHFSTLMHI